MGDEPHRPKPDLQAAKALRLAFGNAVAAGGLPNWKRLVKNVVAGLGGLEPPTLSLGNSCSIHLSYSPTRGIDATAQSNSCQSRFASARHEGFSGCCGGSPEGAQDP